MPGQTWEPHKHPPAAVAGEVHVWRIDLESPELAAAGGQVLSSDEQARAERLVIEEKRAHFIAGRAAIRLLLGGYLARAPEAIQFRYGPNGKPYLAPVRQDQCLHFNFTNSHRLGLLAITVDREIGIDIEFRHRDISVMPLARHILSEQETTAFNRIPPQRHKQELLAIWTRKEAYIKALGAGLSIPLKSFQVAIAPASETTLMPIEVSGDTQSWWFASLHPHPDYLASLAARGADWTLQRLEWQSSR